MCINVLPSFVRSNTEALNLSGRWINQQYLFVLWTTSFRVGLSPARNSTVEVWPFSAARCMGVLSNITSNGRISMGHVMSPVLLICYWRVGSGQVQSSDDILISPAAGNVQTCLALFLYVQCCLYLYSVWKWHWKYFQLTFWVSTFVPASMNSLTRSLSPFLAARCMAQSPTVPLPVFSCSWSWWLEWWSGGWSVWTRQGHIQGGLTWVELRSSSLDTGTFPISIAHRSGMFPSWI